MSRDIDNKVEEAIVIDSSSDEPEVIDITETEVVNETTELYNPEFQDFFLEELEEYVQNMSTDVEVEAINENGNDTMRIFQMAEERTQKNSTPIEDNVFESDYGPLPNPP
jgi:methyltransferase-like protein